MKRILVPTQSANDWKPLLAKPDLHWKPGASAMAAASSWESTNGFPDEARDTLNSGPIELRDLDLLIAVPEWEVALPGGSTASHTDVLAVGTNSHGLVIVAVEAKVEEPFGPTIGEKRSGASKGQEERLRFLCSTLGLSQDLDGSIRYQLLHRTASAVLTARQFHAHAAVMLVQSFSAKSSWQEDFETFASAIGAPTGPGSVARVPSVSSPDLYIGWCAGDKKHLSPIG